MGILGSETSRPLGKTVKIEDLFRLIATTRVHCSFGLICVSYLCVSLWTLRLFPPVNGDEVSNTVFGYNFAHHRGMRSHLMDDVFEPSLTSIADGGFELTRVIYNP